VKNISQEIKNLGMKVMLSVHYSDSWADPSHQTKPQEWDHISFASLKDSISVYTKKIVTEINPDYIQIGNEINNGFIFPEGNIQNLAQMKSLLQAGISAVKSTNPTTKVILHFAGFQNANSFFSQFSDLNYDLIGISYYPNWHGKNLTELQQNLEQISNTQNKSIFIAETSYPFTFRWNDLTQNVIGDTSQILPEYAATETGQKNYLLKIKEIVTNVPKGMGFCYWGAEWISYKGSTSTDGSSWENQAFWDFNHKILPVSEGYK
jgi:arabinogalactan endo-1,4-beta-galactosidase